MRTTIKQILAFFITWTARGVLWRTKPRIIAIAGSVGKTSVKNAVYSILKDAGSVRMSGKTAYEEIDIPLAIIGADVGYKDPLSWVQAIFLGIAKIIAPGKYPKTLVLEIGVHAPGDVSKIARWLKPHIVVLTRLPDVPVHVEFFPTLESLIEEKVSLARSLRKEGTLILNADDPRVLATKEKIQSRTVTYGMTAVSMIRGSNISIFTNELSSEDQTNGGGITFKVDFDGKSFPVVLNAIYSESYVSVALAALAVAHTLEINMVSAIGSLAQYQTPPGRVHILSGKEHTTIIDDSYNSSPAACEAGLLMLKSIPFGKRKIAILGDMLELGKHTDEEHRRMGALAKECVDVLVAVGLRARNFAEGARAAGMNEDKIYIADDAKSAGELVGAMLKKDEVIFVKGSQAMRMERTVKTLMAEPEKASKLLVRQDREWNEKGSA